MGKARASWDGELMEKAPWRGWRLPRAERVVYSSYMTTLLDVDGVIAHLRARCEALNGQTAFANKHGLSKQYVNDVILRRRAPGKAILAALKIDHVDRYILRSS